MTVMKEHTMYLVSILALVLLKVASFKSDINIHKGRKWESSYNDSSTIHIHKVKSFRHFASSDSHETCSPGDRVLHLVAILRYGGVETITASGFHKDWLQGRVNSTVKVDSEYRMSTK
jgi:hypothetical protein